MRKANKIITHHVDGTILKGTTLDFFPTKPMFHLTTDDGTVHEIVVKELKAIFFVKKLEGKADYKERKGFFSPENKGKKIMVEFQDGEIIFGYTLTYSPKNLGFFMMPGDPNCNNEKIFVVHSATKRIKVQPPQSSSVKKPG